MALVKGSRDPAARDQDREPQMIDGAQIRQGRTLLRWTPKHLAKVAGVRAEAINRAECSSGELPLTVAKAAAIQRALEDHGVEFTNGTVRLKGQAST